MTSESRTVLFAGLPRRRRLGGVVTIAASGSSSCVAFVTDAVPTRSSEDWLYGVEARARRARARPRRPRRRPAGAAPRAAPRARVGAVRPSATVLASARSRAPTGVARARARRGAVTSPRR